MAGQKKIVYPIKLKFTIGSPVFFNSAEDKYTLHKEIVNTIIDSLKGEFNVGYLMRNKNFVHGINAQSINEALRDKLKSVSGIMGETNVVFGSFLPPLNTKGEFDFCVYDKESNFYNFWNYCFGKTGAVRNGEEVVDYYIKDNKLKKEWETFLEVKKPRKYEEDLVMPANVFNLIGEIQFGNWAMVYKDMFRLVSAINKKAKIDLYIYVVADGELLKLMSDNIVNFKDACKRFKENVENHNINKPVIILPLDVDFKVAEYDFSEAEIGYKRICDEIQNCEKKIAYYKNRIKVFRSEKKGLKQDKLKRKNNQITRAMARKTEYEERLQELLNQYKENEESDD